MAREHERSCELRGGGLDSSDTALAVNAQSAPSGIVGRMCSNYEPVTLQDRLLANFGVVRPTDEEPPEFTFPGYIAPIIVRADDKVEVGRECKAGRYGLLPHWAPNLAFGKKTYNARAETVAEKPSFKDAWKRGHRCIIPAEAIFEFCYETGKAVKWAIKRADGAPMGIAGLWGYWVDPKTGERLVSFTMLTVNAYGHAIYQRMHKPGEEKRMPAILDEAEYDAWLNCPVEQARSYLQAFSSERLKAEPWRR